MAPHSSAPAWKIPRREEPGGLQSMGWLRVGHNWATSVSLFTFMHWRRKWQPTPVFLPGTGEPGGLPSMGSHGVGHDWSDLAAAAASEEHLSLEQFGAALRLPRNCRSGGSVFKRYLRCFCRIRRWHSPSLSPSLFPLYVFPFCHLLSWV